MLRRYSYTPTTGSPFTLTSAWQKVGTVDGTINALRVAPVAIATAYDIEWIAIPIGSSAPTDTYGEPILGGEDFLAGIPLGDLYLKSATGQLATVKVGS